MARKRVPVGSPRYKSAVMRTEAVKASKSEAGQQLMQDNKMRAVVAQPPQDMSGGKKNKIGGDKRRRKPSFQR